MTRSSSENGVTPDAPLTREDPAPGAGTPRAWRSWLLLVLVVGVAGSVALWISVVLIDPFSTGRFALTGRVDITTTNPRLADAALVRDLRFNGLILGDSVAATLNPQGVAGKSKWRLLQLSMYGAYVTDAVTVASAFERYHHDGATLQIFVLSNQWCGTTLVPIGVVAAGVPIPFQGWLYESSDAVYLSRLLSSQAVALSLKRVSIWLGRSRNELRADGFFERSFKPLPSAMHKQRPTWGPSPEEPFPSIDVLAAHIAALPEQRAIAIVMAPLHVSTLPVEGSIAAARLDACKQRIREIVSRRPRAVYLDLMIESTLTEAAENFADPMHMQVAAVPQFEARIAQLLEQSGLTPD